MDETALILRRINELLLSSGECRIASFDGSRLVVIGSFDLSYYHDFEVEFEEVSYLQCATYFDAQRLRLASANEAAQLRRNHRDYIDDDDQIFCIEADEKTFFIAAQNLILREGRAFHYDRAQE